MGELFEQGAGLGIASGELDQAPPDAQLIRVAQHNPGGAIFATIRSDFGSPAAYPAGLLLAEPMAGYSAGP